MQEGVCDLTMEKKTKRIENKISRTAEMTCISRATSFYEKKTSVKKK